MNKAIVFATALAIALLFASPSIIYHRRQAHFQSVSARVAQHGGTLSFDLQGDYWLNLEGTAADEKSIETLLPHLRTLPSGFTLIGPGEGRHFYVRISDSNITADGLNDLCKLPISSLELTKCPNLADDAVDALMTLSNPNACIGGDIQLSPDALERLRQRLANAF